MKTTSALSLLGASTVAHAQWWDGAPDCAQNCFSSLWDSAIAWPAPTSYCTASQGASVSSCLQAACSATPTAAASYSSLSSSLCSRWSQCSGAGSTGVYTVSAPAFTGNWPGHGGRDRDDDDDKDHGRDGWGDLWDDIWDWADDHDDNDSDSDGWRDEWDQWTRTWTGGVYTVTGCEWAGNVWAGGPGGCGRGCSPWGPWGRGWSHTTVTETVTRVMTITGEGGTTALSTSVGLATVAKAISGDVTSTSIVGGAQQTGGGGDGNGNGGGGGDGNGDGSGSGRNEIRAMGVVLGGVVAVAALL